MRILALAMMAVMSSASAESIAYLANKGGGRIVITDEACSNQKGKIAYTTGDSNTILGCWFIDDLYVHIVWADDGKLRSYPLENWILMPKKTPGRGV
jgi:hypothetical protein